MPEGVDVDAEKGRETDGEQEIEAGHPTADDGSLFQTLLCELSVLLLLLFEWKTSESR